MGVGGDHRRSHEASRPVAAGCRPVTVSRLVRRLAALSLLSSIVGCASAPLFVQPTGENVAAFTLLNDSDMSILPTTYNEKCDVFLLAHIETHRFSPAKLGTSESVKVVIRAGKEFNLKIWAETIMGSNCSFDVAFTPNRGSDYYAVFREKYRRCYISIREARLGDPGERRRVEARLKHISREARDRHDCR